jgi:hypothetical protein
MQVRLLLAVVLMSLILSSGTSLHASAIDSTLFTTYSLSGNDTNINLVVCGSLPGSEGCYGSGSMGPFGRVGAMIEGNPKQNKTAGTVTRYIYVLDVQYGSGGNEVALSIYKKVDTISGSFDTVSVSLFKTLTLPLTGGVNTVASVAANKNFLYLGTDQDQAAVQVQKSNLASSQIDIIPGFVVTSITSDQYGFITIEWGHGAGFYVLNGNGQGQEDGGGAAFMMSTVQATIPSTVQ